MRTLQQVLKEAEEVLKQASIEEASLDAWYIMEYCFSVKKSYYLVNKDEEVSLEQENQYKQLIQQRATHIPLQYITGAQEFMGLDFEVNESVLIPRQDTEVLVEEVLRNGYDKSLLDLCTGSGCIVISLKKYGQLKDAVGVDISSEALAVAQLNAVRNDTEVVFIQSDLFEKVQGKFDIIVSNPPYIETNVIPTLLPEVRGHEPLLALDGGDDGLFFYRQIISQARNYLHKSGQLYVEIGYNQADSVEELFYKYGFVNVQKKKDLAGLDRVVYGKLED